MRSPYKTLGLWVILIVFFVAFYQFFSRREDEAPISWAELEQKMDDGEVHALTVRGNRYTARGEGKSFYAVGPELDVGTARAWEQNGVEIDFQREVDSSAWATVATSWLPLVVMFVFFIFFVRRMGTKPAKELRELPVKAEPVKLPVTLHGLDDARDRLKQLALAVRDGRAAPRKILITGKPGSGKTSLIRAASFDSGVNLIATAGSQFVETFIGVGAARVRDLFDKAKAAQPCIVAIDDVDAFATRRAAPVDGQQAKVEERHQTLVELMNWLDGLQAMPPRMLFIATTSRPELLDEAVVRPGRFDLRVVLDASGAASFEELRAAG